MAGETLIGGGDANKVPPWGPRPEIDYVDKVCPFTSGVWGAVFPVQQFNPLANRTETGMGQAQGTSYQRCNRRCMLFVSDPEVKPDEKARGTCSIQVVAQGGLAATEAVQLLRELSETMGNAQKSAHKLIDKAYEQIKRDGVEPSDDGDDEGDENSGQG